MSKDDILLEEGEGDIIIDLDVPSRTVADKYIEDIKILRDSDKKVKSYDDGVSVEVVEFFEGSPIQLTKVRFKGL